MRTFARPLVAASLLVLSPRLALAQDPPPPPAAPAPAEAPPTVIIIPSDAPPAYPPPAYPPPPGYVPYAAPPGYAPYAAPPVWQAGPTADPAALRRRNKGVMIGGIVMMPIGLAALISGVVATVNLDARSGDLSGFARMGYGFDRMGTVTLAMSGGMMLTAGAIMAGVGGQMVPAKPRRMPRIGVGPGGVSLSGEF